MFLPSLFAPDPAVLILDSFWCFLLLPSLLSPLPLSSAVGIRLVLPSLWVVDLVVIIVDSSCFCSVVVVFVVVVVVIIVVVAAVVICFRCWSWSRRSVCFLISHSADFVLFHGK